MSINMQGPWTVSVTLKEIGSPNQRFIVSGAASGNGTYVGDTPTPAVAVTGDHWLITVQNNTGAGWVDSADQITFPQLTAGNYHFDIQSNVNDGDPILDDLILTCSTPATLGDYLIYGNLSYYGPGCIFNPCFLPILVIESAASLALAVQNPALKVPIQLLYPERIRPVPVPGPDPGPFKAMVIPLRETPALPANITDLLGGVGNTPVARAAALSTPTSLANSTTSASLASSSAASVSFDRLAVASLVDRLFAFCETGAIPGGVLNFQQYDRTNAELAGGPYTGTGPREDLGITASDRNGNYIFRFQRSLAQYIHEAEVDVAGGENLFTEIRPDVIVRMLDAMRAGGYCYESAPYRNIGFLQRINICVPKSCVGRVPTACQGSNAIQGLGNIQIGPPTGPPPFGQPPGYGDRVGFANSLGVDGRITAKNALPDVPQARCAAWAGYLDFFACFLDHPEVVYYTIRWRQHDAPGWQFFREEYLHWKVGNITPIGDLVGPQAGVNLSIDGAPPAPAPAYLNIESDNGWRLFQRDRKAIISSFIYAPASAPGPIDFRIEGYTAAGAKVAAADDMVTLYIDNSNPDFAIDTVTMQAQQGGDCALFNLGGNANLPLTVRFKANQFQRFMNAYGLTVRKGNIPPPFLVNNGGPGQISGVYTHTGDLDLACSSMEGTFDDVTADIHGFVSVDLTATSGHWLEVNQPFCTFAVQLGCSTRVTNGYNTAVQGYGPIEYLLGIQAS
jgi:hypothetical protein